MAEINRIKDYKIIEKLGGGSFGVVYKVQKDNANDIYAIKQINLNRLNEKELQLVNQEAQILSIINSEFVVKNYDYFKENSYIYIIMEYCNGGDLDKFIENRKGKLLEENKIWEIFIKITIGLAEIHKMNILHRDLKPLNIFLNKNKNLEIKIGDFGVSKILSTNNYANTKAGTRIYFSPERILEKPYNKKSDIWGLGCILYKLCTFQHPFEGGNIYATLGKILNSEPNPFNSPYSQDLKNFIFLCLNKNPHYRPTCTEILSNNIILTKARELGLYNYIYDKNIISNLENQNNNQNLMNFALSINDFIDLNKIIGKSNYATVKKMQSKKNGSYYAIKIIQKDKKSNTKNLFREKIFQKLIDHENIVKLYFNFEDSKNYYLVFEYISNYNLEIKIENHLKSFNYQNVQLIKENLIIFIFKQLLNGLEYLHSINIIHRNIKPENILFDKDNKIKITDFGYSAFIKPQWEILPFDEKLCSNNSFISNEDYGAPEILKRKKYDFKSDIYSLGLIIFKLMTFKLPFYSMTTNDNRLTRISNQVEISNFYSNNLKNLVKRMISENPNDRPTAKEAKEELLQIRVPDNNLLISINLRENQKFELSSFISVITCLCEIDDINYELLKNIISNKYINNFNFLKTYLPINVIEMRDIIEYNKNKWINKNVFEDCFHNLNSLLSSKTNNIILGGDNNPKNILRELIINFSKEFKDYLPNIKNSFPNPYSIINRDLNNWINEINQIIKDFTSNYAGPFVRLFYFIESNLTSCKFCEDYIFGFKGNIRFSISIQTSAHQNLMKLIKFYINQEISNNNNLCPNCNTKIINEKLFLNSPKYLIIEFENINSIILDDTIDLSNYILTDIGPKKYDFFAVISRENINNEYHFVSGIKKYDKYFFISDNNYEKCGEEVKKYGLPYIAIYKGQNYN